MLNGKGTILKTYEPREVFEVFKKGFVRMSISKITIGPTAGNF